MEGRFRRVIDELPRIFEMSGEFCSAHGIESPDHEQIDVVIEEIFTNIVRHGSASDDDVLVRLERTGDGVAVSLIDFDAEPFDPSVQPEPSTSAPLEEREPGGLGIHLVRQLSNEIEYEHHDRTSRVTVRRKLG